MSSVNQSKCTMRITASSQLPRSQRRLAASSVGKVTLRPYFTDVRSGFAASMVHNPDRLRLTETSDDSVVSVHNEDQIDRDHRPACRN